VEQKKNNSPIQINDFKLIWRVIAKNWYIPVIIVPIFFLLGYFYVYKIENVYEASVELLKSNDTYYEKSLITDNADISAAKSFIDNSNEIRIVQSYDLMKETVERVKKSIAGFLLFGGKGENNRAIYGNAL
jgi:capsular polysaccharide biosynthesis protein